VDFRLDFRVDFQVAFEVLFINCPGEWFHQVLARV
jgi:hypothetical protein